MQSTLNERKKHYKFLSVNNKKSRKIYTDKKKYDYSNLIMELITPYL